MTYIPDNLGGLGLPYIEDDGTGLQLQEKILELSPLILRAMEVALKPDSPHNVRLALYTFRANTTFRGMSVNDLLNMQIRSVFSWSESTLSEEKIREKLIAQLLRSEVAAAAAAELTRRGYNSEEVLGCILDENLDTILAVEDDQIKYWRAYHPGPCEACKIQGHSGRNCPRGKCQKCDRKGHNARNCQFGRDAAGAVAAYANSKDPIAERTADRFLRDLSNVPTCTGSGDLIKSLLVLRQQNPSGIKMDDLLPIMEKAKPLGAFLPNGAHRHLLMPASAQSSPMSIPCHTALPSTPSQSHVKCIR